MVKFFRRSRQNDFTGTSDNELSIYEKIKTLDIKHEIRLLTIEPSNKDQQHTDGSLQPTTGYPNSTFSTKCCQGEPLICRLEVRRDDKAVYSAISYTWGTTYAEGVNDEGKRTIMCNGQFVEITENCFNILTTLRHCNMFGPFWIDQICIDQSNIDERNDHVRCMGDIYRQAKQTIVYLCSEKMGLMAPVAPLPRVRIFPTDKEQTYEIVDRDYYGFGNEELYVEGSALLEPELFFRSPWFTRTWIIQEIMLSSSVVVLPEFGDFTIPLDIVQKTYKIWAETCQLTGIPEVIRMKQRDQGLGMKLQRLIESSVAHSPMHYHMLFDVLEATRGFKCKDPRDKLFAILALFPSKVPTLLQPHYGKLIQHVYADLSWFLLTLNRPEVLSLASRHASLCDNNFSQPSWLVNWSDPIPQADRLERHNGGQHWNAGVLHDSQDVYVRKISRDGLRLRGVKIGHIENCISDGKSPATRMRTCHGHTTFRTRQHQATMGDEAYVLLGFRVPLLLHPTDRGFQLVDECFVAGFMFGEALAGLDLRQAYRSTPSPGLVDINIW